MHPQKNLAINIAAANPPIKLMPAKGEFLLELKQKLFSSFWYCEKRGEVFQPSVFSMLLNKEWSKHSWKLI